MMFLKANRSMNPNNTSNVAKPLIWNTLIPSHLELPNAIDNSDDNENEKDDDEDDDLSPVSIEIEEADYTC